MKLYEALKKDGNYERRKSQEEMFNIINKHLNQPKSIALIEAPTGTGKSYGYLLPIIEGNHKAIISTKTKILQEQLRVDLKKLSSLSNKPIKYLILKGKSNYLCLDRLHKRLRKKIENKQKNREVENTILTNLAYDPPQNWDGDIETVEYQIPIPKELWNEINVDDDICDAAYRKVCKHRENCYYYAKLKKQEGESDIIIANHTLLALKHFEFDTEDRVLVIDEAHELDEALTKALTCTLSTLSLKQIVGKTIEILGNDSEMLSIDIDSIFKNLFEKLFIGSISSIPLDNPFFVNDIITNINTIYDSLSNALSHLAKKYGFDTNAEKIEIKNEIIQSLFQIFKHVKAKVDGIKKVIDLLTTLTTNDKHEYGIAVSREFSKHLNNFNYKIEVFPIFPHGVLNLQAYRNVILTSATLDKELVKQTTGITGDFYSLDHVFDYSRVNFIIRNTDPKKDPIEWQKAVKESYRYIRTLHKKVLVLFTNKEHIKFIDNEDDVIFQEETGLRKAIELLKGDKNVLVGVDSLWTGLDIKGEKGILISKLPFDPPTNPLHYYRAKYLKEHNQDAQKYFTKKMITKFKQGFGRMMRDKNDKGTIILCDSRIIKYKELIDFIYDLGVVVSLW